MLAFVDESGDSGRKLDQGSSLYFVVSIVIFEDHDEADACDQRIEALRQELGLEANFEFHFSHNSKRIREAFLTAVSRFNFTFHTFALNKGSPKLTGPGFDHGPSLYKFTARMVFENAEPSLDDAVVVVDRSGGKTFRDELASYLRIRIKGGGWRLELFRDGELLATFPSAIFGTAVGFSKCWDASMVPGAPDTPWLDGCYWVEFHIFTALSGVGEITLSSE